MQSQRFLSSRKWQYWAHRFLLAQSLCGTSKKSSSTIKRARRTQTLSSGKPSPRALANLKKISREGTRTKRDVRLNNQVEDKTDIPVKASANWMRISVLPVFCPLLKQILEEFFFPTGLAERERRRQRDGVTECLRVHRFLALADRHCTRTAIVECRALYCPSAPSS